MVINKGYTIIVVHVGQMLRKAGRAIMNMDQAYADRIKGMYGVQDGAPTGEGLAALSQALGAGFLGGVSQREIMQDSTNSRAGKAAYSLANLGARYAAPTVGVAAAYHGIQGLMPGEQTSGTVMPQ